MPFRLDIGDAIHGETNSIIFSALKCLFVEVNRAGHPHRLAKFTLEVMQRPQE